MILNACKLILTSKNLKMKQEQLIILSQFFQIHFFKVILIQDLRHYIIDIEPTPKIFNQTQLKMKVTTDSFSLISNLHRFT